MSPTTVIPESDLSTARSTTTNWKNQLGAIVDGYRQYHSVTHGVQKDAVQNGWDARVNKKSPQNWSIVFELIEEKGGNTYFTMTDAGTTGLTGSVLKPEQLLEDLPVEERWGRFENLAFTKNEEEEAIGARGRGKFIFVGASENSEILYDTLRSDDIYRFGFRTITLTDSPIAGSSTKLNIFPISYLSCKVSSLLPITKFIFFNF